MTAITTGKPDKYTDTSLIILEMKILNFLFLPAGMYNIQMMFEASDCFNAEQFLCHDD